MFIEDLLEQEIRRAAISSDFVLIEAFIFFLLSCMMQSFFDGDRCY
jgi:hypothetical protein